MWSPDRGTVVHVGGTTIGLTLYEMTVKVEVVYVSGKYVPVRDLTDQQLRRYTGIHHWRTHQDRPSGRVCLQAYCPSGLVNWSKRWQETKPGTFRGMVPGIVKELEATAPDLVKQIEEATARAEAEHRRWQEEMRRQAAEEERRRQQKASDDARRDLLGLIAAWDEARRVRAYFDAVDLQLAALPGDEGEVLRERLSLAKELVGELDPLAKLKAWKSPSERLAAQPRPYSWLPSS